MIKAVAFDFDHTLYDRDKTLENMTDDFCLFFKNYLKEGISRAQVLRVIQQADLAGFAPPGTPARKSSSIKRPWNSIYQATVDSGIFHTVPSHEQYYYDFIFKTFPKHIAMYDDAVPTLLHLRKLGYTTGLLTNGMADFQKAKLDAVNLHTAIDKIVLCGDLEYQKPHPSSYEAICKAMGCAPYEAVYVGDNPVNDVEGARRAGMIPVWMRSIGLWFDGLEPAPYCIDSIGELPELLEQIKKDNP